MCTVNLKTETPLKMLNLACGTVTHPVWINVDFSAYTRVVKFRRVAGLAKKVGILNDIRYGRLMSLSGQIICHKGIPFPSNSVDVIYHSHFVEHLARQDATRFILECHRVLKTHGVMRIATPDFDYYVHRYVVSSSEAERANIIVELFNQFVWQEVGGTLEQNKFMRFVERTLGRTAESVGQLHKWIYNFHTLSQLLTEVGFSEIERCEAHVSRIPSWESIGLDIVSGQIRKPESLFVEAVKPSRQARAALPI
jgi:SAM-dependent methyltransferase